MDGAEIPRNWRREGGNRLRPFAMPELVVELWKKGLVTQAQSLNAHFWETQLCQNLIDLAYLQEATLIWQTFSTPIKRE